MAAYRLLRDNPTVQEGKQGDVVYDYRGCDYGLANDDTRGLGVYHISVTFDPAGRPPFFTIPACILEELP